jgi:uncharacterized protein (TIGR02598 family)
MSLAIASLAVLTIVGVLPVGLKSVREVSVENVRTAILETIQSEAAATLWDDLPSLHGETRTFNEQGLPAPLAGARYVVTLSVVSPTMAPDGRTPLPQLATIKVSIRMPAAPAETFDSYLYLPYTGR